MVPAKSQLAKTQHLVKLQQFNNQAQSSASVDEPAATTDAGLAALAMETGLVEPENKGQGINEPRIEQMDGAYDDEDGKKLCSK